MSTNVRMIIAMAVSVVIVILWSMFILPKTETPVDPGQESKAVQEENVNQESAEEVATPEENRSVEAEESDYAEALETTPETLVKADTVSNLVVESDLYKVEISNQAGGSVKSWIIKGHKKSFSDEPFDLIASEEVRGNEYKPFSTVIRDKDGNYNQIPGLSVVSGDISDNKLIFSNGQATVFFKYVDQTLGTVEKEITFYQESYSVKVSLKNELTKQSKGSEVLLMMGGGVGDLVKYNNEGVVEPGREANGFLLKKAGAGIEKVPALIAKINEEEFAKLKGKTFTELTAQGKDFYAWAGLENNYFMTLAYGDTGFGFFPVYKIQGLHEVQSGENKEYVSMPYLGLKTEKDEATFKVYCGPKDLDILEQTDNGALKEVISFGMFSFISRPALWVMQQINSVTNNYGWAIILLTIAINLLTLPLIIKQRKSMSQMQLIQPQIKALQAKHKVEKSDDIKKRQAKKQQLNEEMMALYKAEGVNPMGGCMPMLIQLPILFALLDMFRVAIELRKAPWILWWDNLSAMDPTYVLPIVMAGAMFLSMKLTPSAPDQQNSAMKFMPFLFAFMLASMPSGLVLYWTTSNLFSLGTQVIMNKVSPVKKGSEPEKPGKAKKTNKKEKK